MKILIAVLALYITATSSSALFLRRDEQVSPFNREEYPVGAAYYPHKSTKCPKSIRELSADYEPLGTRTDNPPELVDADFWHPKSSNFEIIDWEKWNAECGVPSYVFDPPQRNSRFNKRQEQNEMVWWHRSKLDFPGDDWFTSTKPNYGLVSDKALDLFSKILGPNPNSELVPEPLRNKLLWMEHNDASEALVSFNRWAWRSQVDDNKGRVIGLGQMASDWTNSPNARGKVLESMSSDGFINIQASPDGKWMKLAVITPSSPFLGPPSSSTSRVLWLNIYIVQKGDMFTDREGKILDYVKPGDLLRTHYDLLGFDAYNCEPDDFQFQYFPRVVATLDEKTGKITAECPHYEALIESATSQPSKELELATFGFTDATPLTQEERWDFQTTFLSDIQMYASAATPPSGDDIENL